MDLEELLEEQRQLLMQKDLGVIHKKQDNKVGLSQGINFGLPSKDEMQFNKVYNWSSPFMISEVGQFTL